MTKHIKLLTKLKTISKKRHRPQGHIKENELNFLETNKKLVVNIFKVKYLTPFPR